jgi:succinate-semialdehyde dehydrogenase/glutarate-semialdehyde dehydrogenase
VVYVPNCQVPYGLNYSDDPSILSKYENLNPQCVEESNIFFREEIFGPVFPITTYNDADLDHGVFIANSTEYGLGSTIVGDVKLAEEVSKRLDFGMTFINQPVGSYSELPCGGTKNSGWGRDCGRHGFEAFGNVKTLWIQK